MMSKSRGVFLLLAFAMVCSLFTACGSPDKKVPDSYLVSYLTRRCEEEGEEASDLTFSAKHDYDPSSHIDTVLVTMSEKGHYGTRSFRLEVKYQYNRSSDLWSLFAESEWPDEYVYTFNNNILGEYDFYVDGDRYTNYYGDVTVNIKSVDSDGIKAEYSVDGDAYYNDYRGYEYETRVSADGRDAYEFIMPYWRQCGVNIPISAPDGWHGFDHYTDYNHDYFSIHLVFDVNEGVRLDYVDSIIYG